MAGDLDSLAGLVTAFRDARDWSQFHSLRNLIVSLNLEAGELLELTQWKTDDEIAAIPADLHAREALEETAHGFQPEFLVGIYQWPRPAGDITYLRIAFGGSITGFDPERKLDTGIVRAVWLTLDELRATRERHRSPLILQCCEDYMAGRRYPLDLIRHYDA